MKLIFILTFIFSFGYVKSQTSRLSIEPIGYLSYNFSRFNQQTIPTTSNGFYKINAFGKREEKNGIKSTNSIDNEFNRQFEVGLIIHYKLKYKLAIDLCAQTSWVGAIGGGGIYSGESGGSLRTIRYSISPVYQIGYLKKHKLSIHAGLGIMFDLVSKSTPAYTGGYSAGPIDTFSWGSYSKILNKTGLSLHPNLQFKMKLENGNSLNVHITGAIGLVPLVSNNFTYSRNQDDYYTELWSNGSFFRIGIGYEFQFLKRIFTYPGIGTKYEQHYE